MNTPQEEQQTDPATDDQAPNVPSVEGAREALVERIAETVDAHRHRLADDGSGWECLCGQTFANWGRHQSHVAAEVAAEVAAAVSEAQAEARYTLSLAEQVIRDKEAEVERLREGIRAEADFLNSHHDGTAETRDYPMIARYLRALLAPSPAGTTGEADGEHEWWDVEHGRMADAYTPPEDVRCRRCRQRYNMHTFMDGTCHPAPVVTPSAEGSE